MCDVHKNKKVKFFCKSDHEMFCSKCVLKHTNAKHDVMPCSYKSKSPPTLTHLEFFLRIHKYSHPIKNVLSRSLSLLLYIKIK